MGFKVPLSRSLVPALSRTHGIVLTTFCAMYKTALKAGITSQSEKGFVLWVCGCASMCLPQVNSFEVASCFFCVCMSFVLFNVVSQGWSGSAAGFSEGLMCLFIDQKAFKIYCFQVFCYLTCRVNVNSWSFWAEKAVGSCFISGAALQCGIFGACDRFHVLATRQSVSCLVVHAFPERNTNDKEGTRFLMARPQESVTTSFEAWSCWGLLWKMS